MTLGACQLPDCTVAITGRCVQGYAVDECPNRGGSNSINTAGPMASITAEPEVSDAAEDGNVKTATASAQDIGFAGSPVLERPTDSPRLPGSGTMGIVKANALMCDHYTNLIGIVGLPDSGKTACLVSTYLLLAKGQFSGFSYVDSQTLMAFEEIARGSRRWNNGAMPVQMTVHTEMADDREAGFLHLKLRRNADGEFYDLLLPDLPGEWSKTLIDKNDAARFAFLNSAAVIWLMVDGRQFAQLQTRGYAVYRTQCLLERLSNVLRHPRPRLMLVSSWRDIGEFPEDSFKEIQAEAAKWRMEITLYSIASFSDNDLVAPGEGLAELIESTVKHNLIAPKFWPDEPRQSRGRALLRYGSSN